MPDSMILKVGGSSLGLDGIDAEKVKSICSVIKDLRKRLTLGVVVGAGKVGGGYVNAAREMGVNEFQLDSLAIDVSRLNAKLIARGIGIKSVVPSSTRSNMGFRESEKQLN